MEVLSRQSPSERIEVLLSAWRTAPDDADIELRTGRTDTGQASILVSIGATDIPLSADEADALCIIAKRHAMPPAFRQFIDGILRASKASRDAIPSPQQQEMK